jgi:hypothetical protein
MALPRAPKLLSARSSPVLSHVHVSRSIQAGWAASHLAALCISTGNPAWHPAWRPACCPLLLPAGPVVTGRLAPRRQRRQRPPPPLLARLVPRGQRLHLPPLQHLEAAALVVLRLAGLGWGRGSSRGAVNRRGHSVATWQHQHQHQQQGGC